MTRGTRHIPKAGVRVLVVEGLKAVCFIELSISRCQLACKVLAGTVRVIMFSNHHLGNGHCHRFLTVGSWSLNRDGNMSKWLVVIAGTNL